MDQETEVNQLTAADMADALYSDLLDPLEDVELSGAARERIDWARGELFERLGWLTCSMPAGYPNVLAKLAGDESNARSAHEQSSEDDVDNSAFEEWLGEALRVLADGRYLRNVVRREVLLVTQPDMVPEEIKAPCHHEEEKESAVVH